jgi:predicted metallopeptidase
MHKLFEIYRETRNKDRYQLVKKLQKELSIRDAEPNKDLRKLADQIINKFPEFNFISEYDIKIGYVLSQEKPAGSKIKYADCEKVKLKHQAWLPYDFIITFYEPNTELLSENQKKILMLHELKHIGIGEKGLKLEDHDIEDFKDILKQYARNLR